MYSILFHPQYPQRVALEQGTEPSIAPQEPLQKCVCVCVRVFSTAPNVCALTWMGEMQCISFHIRPSRHLALIL